MKTILGAIAWLVDTMLDWLWIGTALLVMIVIGLIHIWSISSVYESEYKTTTTFVMGIVTIMNWRLMVRAARNVSSSESHSVGPTKDRVGITKGMSRWVRIPLFLSLMAICFVGIIYGCFFSLWVAQGHSWAWLIVIALPWVWLLGAWCAGHVDFRGRYHGCH
jgi:protein-S-isoprenylcysteine O-methyltransferase Ste14